MILAVIFCFCLVGLAVAQEAACANDWASLNHSVLSGDSVPTMSRPTAIEAEAQVTDCPPSVLLRWRPQASRTAGFYSVWRRLGDGARDRTPIVVLPRNATEWHDTSAPPFQAIEYLVAFTTTNTTNIVGVPQAYVRAGIRVPTVKRRGGVLLLVELALHTALAALPSAEGGGNLDVLRADLEADGWDVAVATVAANASVAQVKQTVVDAYRATPGLRALFLLGRIPVPYSGNQAPDGHVSDHMGAWPCDSFYGDVDYGPNDWTDRSNYSAATVDARIRNNAGDGKFDATQITGALELHVGRVDFSRITVFAAPFNSEVNLTTRYIAKAHKFRTAESTFARRSFLRVSFDQYSTGQGPLRFMRPLFGDMTVLGADQLVQTLQNKSSLLSAGDGPGSYTSCGSVTTSSALAAANPRVVMFPLFGSYFGDFDVQNNLLRVAIGTAHTLVTWWHAWPGLPATHQLALGATTGEFANASQSRNAPSSAQWPFPEGGSGGSLGRVYVNLIGDPTLRLFAVPPVTGLTADASACGTVKLSWTDGVSAPSDDTAPLPPTLHFEVLDENWNLLQTVTAPTYSLATTSAATFRVRAVRLETTKSGTFLNPSLAVTVTTAAPATCPTTTTTTTAAAGTAAASAGTGPASAAVSGPGGSVVDTVSGGASLVTSAALLMLMLVALV